MFYVNSYSCCINIVVSGLRVGRATQFVCTMAPKHFRAVQALALNVCLYNNYFGQL